jgi:beta-lactamase regulating signal transducer with metallopeptidase domain
MERLLLECAVRAALLVGGTAIVLYAMRVKRASSKHSVWSGVVGVMLLLPMWTVWGPKASLRLLPPTAPITASVPVPQSVYLPTALLPSAQISAWQAVLLAVYLLGLLLLLFRLGAGTVRARRLLCDSVPHDSIRISSFCAAPVTVGFFRPVVILPEHSCQWTQAQFEAVLTHEREHARRRDSLVQWLALLNRALFWFHPAAWWLERTLSALAEEACDNVVLARGHNPREYAECLLTIARSVTRSGGRVNVAGMAMPGSFLPRRIRQIMEGTQAPRILRTRMARVAVACAITCTAFTAGRLDHAKQNFFAPLAITQRNTESDVHPATKFVLGDLKIEGNVHDRDGVRARVLKAWKDREFDDVKELKGEVMEVGVRKDFQDRGYFKVFAKDPVTQPLGLADGRQRILIMATITEGDQFQLGNFTIQNNPPDRPLSIPEPTLREQFHLRRGDLFNVSEVRAGLERVRRLYDAKGLEDANEEPATTIDDTHKIIDLTLRITEGVRTK